jgi:shikimate dehydrogenase
MIDVDTQLCGVIGNPVGHSLSPVMHNAGYEAQGLNFVYLAFEVSDVGACLAGMRSMRNFRGLSVTIPHKLDVIAHLDEVEVMALNVGSVNTIMNVEGRLVGSTTDGLGATLALEGAGVDLDGKRVLFLGAGGAVRAVAFAVAEGIGDGSIMILGRNTSRVEGLLEDLREKAGVDVSMGDLVDDVAEAVAGHDVIIQGTPVGMYPESVGESCVPGGCLHEGQVVFDMVYRPLKTRLIEDAEAAGCRTILGREMLVQQAAAQYGLWTGGEAPVDVMRDALLGGLAGEE